jgi:predicted ATPase/class 3 adenylate cyclase
MPLPTGTVTFLFTDIEGSTQRWDANREAMQTAVTRHDEIVRAAIESHNGYVFKTLGDAFCSAFDTVSDAIAAAIEGQTELSKHDFDAVDGLRVRMALHTGNANEREGDYFGPAVNRVARLLSVGHGGQVLLSGVTAELGKADLPTRTTLRDLGTHRLKDLSNPEHVYQLVTPEFAQSFPALRSLEAVPNNLPLQLTSFRGRDQDLLEISDILKDARLLTLFGTGGVGKTRLALQTGAELLERYPDGVWYIELASITDLGLVPSIVSSVLNVNETPGRSLTESIVAALNRKRLLIILDNCEHVLDAVVQIASAILHGCPEVHIVVTSRQALGIAGETVLQVSSLSVPPAGAPPDAEEAMKFGAVALFVDRASAINRAFRLTNDTAPIVAEICRRLDGIALAIELAAARVKVLSIPQLAERLSERFRILTSGDRTVLKRQQTMRALIDWSYDQLTDNEKLLFLRISVFAGTFTLDAAGEVCSQDRIDPLDILDLLTSLVDKSLLVAETTHEVGRFRLLESTREYALEKLRAGEEHERLARAHADYYLKVAYEADTSWGKTTRDSWFAKFRPELDNFRAAMDWGLTRGRDVDLGAAIAAYAAYLWYDAGLNTEGTRWIELAQNVADPQLTDGTKAKLWVALAPLVSGKRVYDAGTEAKSLYEKLGDRRGVALADIQRAFGLFQTGRVKESFDFLPQAVTVFRELGEPRILSISLSIYGLVLWVAGDFDLSRRSYSEALALGKSMNDERRVAIIQQNLAEVEVSLGNLARSLELSIEVKKFYQRDYDPRGLAGNSGNMAAYYILLNRFDEAEDNARQAVRYGRESQDTYIVGIGAQHLAYVAATRRVPKIAARFLGYADSVYHKLSIQREPTEAKLYAALLKMLRDQLTDSEIEALRAEGAALTDDQIADLPLTEK